MIRKLRGKFVCTVMAIVAVMLLAILSVVIFFTAENMETQSVNMMRAVASARFQPGRGPHEVRLPYFVARVGSRGEVLSANGAYFEQPDGEYIQSAVDAALATGQESGKLTALGLRFLKSPAPGGSELVFADISSETATLRAMLLTCLLIFLAAMLVFLGLSLLLSRWAVRPVEQAWEQQRQFVADASHELKTPLTVIMANAELLEGEDFGEEEQRTFTRNIRTMTVQMRALVEELLELARMDSAGGKLALSEVDLSQLVSDAVLSFQLLYEEKGMGLQSAVAEGIQLRGSEPHLFRVLDVLLDNALKYSTPGGPVRVELKRGGSHCLLTVSGPGTPMDKQTCQEIFKRFYRADKARARNGSYGLGLAIAQSVVDAHKGRIWAESTNGQNTFLVQLPM